MPSRCLLSALSLALTLSLVACQPDAAPPAPVVAPAASRDAPVAAPPESMAENPVVAAPAACPHAEFDTFLAHFGSELTLQEASVADPLIDEHVEVNAEPEPHTVTRNIALQDVTWPVMPDPATVGRMGRSVDITREDDGSMKVQIRTPDTSDQQSYYFAQRPCWQLVRRVDEAI